MTPIFKHVVFEDEWQEPDLGAAEAKFIAKTPKFLRPLLSPLPYKTYNFTNYALGYRFEATQRELKLLQRHSMFNQTALTLRKDDPPLTFADLCGPELIPEVNPNQQELLRIEARVREAALVWSHFFEGMKD